VKKKCFYENIVIIILLLNINIIYIYNIIRFILYDFYSNYTICQNINNIIIYAFIIECKNYIIYSILLYRNKDDIKIKSFNLFEIN
jgi:hypothetical protein